MKPAPLRNRSLIRSIRVETGKAVRSKTDRSKPSRFPEAWRKMGEGGWLAMNMPPDFGGMGLPELVTVAARVQPANQSLCIGNTLTTGAPI